MSFHSSLVTWNAFVLAECARTNNFGLQCFYHSSLILIAVHLRVCTRANAECFSLSLRYTRSVFCTNFTWGDEKWYCNCILMCSGCILCTVVDYKSVTSRDSDVIHILKSGKTDVFCFFLCVFSVHIYSCVLCSVVLLPERSLISPIPLGSVHVHTS